MSTSISFITSNKGKSILRVIEEVYFRQQMIHMKSGKSKTKSKKTRFMQDRLATLSSRFDNQEIDIQEYLQGLSFLVAKDVKNKK
jgi:hypothetical protein